MRRLIATLVLACPLSWGDVLVGFPSTTTSQAMAASYESEMRLYERVLGEPIDFATYDISDTGAALKIAREGLIAATPANTQPLIELGLTPVGYHAGEATIVLAGQVRKNGLCTRVGRLENASMMGLMAPSLIRRSPIEDPCVRFFPDTSNLIRAINLGQIDAAVIASWTLRDLTVEAAVLAQGTTPMFAFLSASEPARYLKMFKTLQADNAKSIRDQPIKAWDTGAAARYLQLHRDLSD